MRFNLHHAMENKHWSGNCKQASFNFGVVALEGGFFPLVGLLSKSNCLLLVSPKLPTPDLSWYTAGQLNVQIQTDILGLVSVKQQYSKSITFVYRQSYNSTNIGAKVSNILK